MIEHENVSEKIPTTYTSQTFDNYHNIAKNICFWYTQYNMYKLKFLITQTSK